MGISRIQSALLCDGFRAWCEAQNLHAPNAADVLIYSCTATFQSGLSESYTHSDVLDILTRQGMVSGRFIR